MNGVLDVNVYSSLKLMIDFAERPIKAGESTENGVFLRRGII